MGKGVIQSILDFLFPPRCPVCRAYVEQLGDWCPACMKAAQQPHAILLPALSQRFIGAVWALGIYRGGLRSLIHALKYRKKRSALPCIASFLQESSFVLPEGVDVAVPVPLHEARYRQRGFNQVELISGNGSAQTASPWSRPSCARARRSHSTRWRGRRGRRAFRARSLWPQAQTSGGSTSCCSTTS